MVERLASPNNVNFDPDPFVPEFKKQMDQMITQETVKFAAKGAKKSVEYTLPFLLTSCSQGKDDSINISINIPTVLTLISGALLPIAVSLGKKEVNKGRQKLSEYNNKRREKEARRSLRLLVKQSRNPNINRQNEADSIILDIAGRDRRTFRKIKSGKF
jgi:hypothetical protein